MSPELLDSADAALDRECSALSSTARAVRECALNEAAYTIGRLVGAALLKEEFAAKRLGEAARAAGYQAEYGAQYVDRVISSGLAAGIARPVRNLDKPCLMPAKPRPTPRNPSSASTALSRLPEPAQLQKPVKAERQPSPPFEPSGPLTGRQRKRCGARARSKGGAPCQCKVVPGRTRCKFHGGMSTGPKTPEGRARSSEGARRYFAERRAAAGQAEAPV
jgi:hypothetical protein